MPPGRAALIIVGHAHAKANMPDIDSQIDALSLNRSEPLIICDADEVLIEFVRPLERFLEQEGFRLDLKSFQLTGNVRNAATGAAASQEQVSTLIGRYFDEKVDTAVPVEGACEAVTALGAKARLVVLTNVGEAHRARRAAALRQAGLDLPVLANRGAKGPAVARIVDRHRAPIVFIDDLPPHHASVAEQAGHVYRLHFVADPRLARLVDAAEHAHSRFDRWPSGVAHILDHLKTLGH